MTCMHSKSHIQPEKVTGDFLCGSHNFSLAGVWQLIKGIIVLFKLAQFLIQFHTALIQPYLCNNLIYLNSVALCGCICMYILVVDFKRSLRILMFLWIQPTTY